MNYTDPTIPLALIRTVTIHGGTWRVSIDCPCCRGIHNVDAGPVTDRPKIGYGVCYTEAGRAGHYLIAWARAASVTDTAADDDTATLLARELGAKVIGTRHPWPSGRAAAAAASMQRATT